MAVERLRDAQAFRKVSVRAFAKELNISHSTLLKWQEDEDKLREVGRDKLSLHKGPKRKGVEEGHIDFIVEVADSKIHMEEHCSVAYVSFTLAHRDPTFLATAPHRPSQSFRRNIPNQENIPPPFHVNDEAFTDNIYDDVLPEEIVFPHQLQRERQQEDI
ncbi:hypothetical protein BC829DRAFT_420961 [Chytridium lagenaria]|nr:hypothetical protein BC829DRAFT_420961 [Chytridium lagenaria]